MDKVIKIGMSPRTISGDLYKHIFSYRHIDIMTRFYRLMLEFKISEAIKLLYNSFFEFYSTDIEEYKNNEKMLDEKYYLFRLYKDCFSVFLL